MIVDLTQLYFERQFLSAKEKAAAPLHVAGSICGINAQRGVTIYLSCWNRIQGFKKRDLDTQLYETKELVKTWCMRGTVHIIPSDQFYLYQKATNPSRLWSPSDISEDFCEKVVKTLEEPLTKSEIADRIQGKVNLDEKELRVKVGRAVRMLGYRGVVVFGNPRGKGFFFKEYEFVLAQDWVPHEDDAGSEQDTRRILLSNYLECYGPATIQDFAYWAGFKVREARKVLESVDTEEIRIGAKKYYVNPGDDLKIDGETNQIVLLPEYDSYVMGHKDKSRFIEESYRSRVFLPFAQVDPTIVKDGRVIGTWSMKKGKNLLTFQINPFGKLEEHDMCSIREEMEKMSQFMGLDFSVVHELTG